jgi:hypothetical protein
VITSDITLLSSNPRQFHGLEAQIGSYFKHKYFFNRTFMFEPKIPYPEFRQSDLDFEDKYRKAGNGTKKNRIRN